MLQAKIRLASWLLYSTHMYASAYNIDSLYNTGQINLPGIVKIVYNILCMHFKKIKFFRSNIIALSVNMHLQRVL